MRRIADAGPPLCAYRWSEADGQKVERGLDGHAGDRRGGIGISWLTDGWRSPACPASEDHGGNVVYTSAGAGLRRLRCQSNADEVEGDPCSMTSGRSPRYRRGCHRDAASRRGHVRECADSESARVDAPLLGGGSVSKAATEYGRTHDRRDRRRLPCMFGPTADFGHKPMRSVFTLNGNVPRQTPCNRVDRPIPTPRLMWRGPSRWSASARQTACGRGRGGRRRRGPRPCASGR